ncbi:Hypothetical predicted protein, partial [Paramuricea clavata]
DPVVQSLLKNSTILDDDTDDAQQLVEWMKDKKFGWQICYRASEDGWGSADFHRKCDDVGPTVTLIKCGTNVFGGFTDQSWKVSGPCVQTVFITAQNCVDNRDLAIERIDNKTYR